MSESMRSVLLNEANTLVTGDRNNTYGPPHQDFARTAGILTSLGFEHHGKPVEAHHVAMILAAVKLSRLAWSPEKRDSWVDLAGYAACGHEAYELTRPSEEENVSVLTVDPSIFCAQVSVDDKIAGIYGARTTDATGR